MAASVLLIGRRAAAVAAQRPNSDGVTNTQDMRMCACADYRSVAVALEADDAGDSSRGKCDVEAFWLFGGTFAFIFVFLIKRATPRDQAEHQRADLRALLRGLGPRLRPSRQRGAGAGRGLVPSGTAGVNEHSRQARAAHAWACARPWSQRRGTR